MRQLKNCSLNQSQQDQTQTKILKAARHLFVEFGFAGTSIGKIAAIANINHSLIFHHFGNKEGLWKAVKQSIVAEANKLSPTLPKLNITFSGFLKKLIIQNISFYRNHPDIVRMINWQRLEYENKKDIGLTLSQDAEKWLSALKYYQEKGDIAAHLKLEFVLTFILAIISNAAMDPNMFIKKNTAINNYILFVITTLSKGLK